VRRPGRPVQRPGLAIGGTNASHATVAFDDATLPAAATVDVGHAAATAAAGAAAVSGDGADAAQAPWPGLAGRVGQPRLASGKGDAAGRCKRSRGKTHAVASLHLGFLDVGFCGGQRVRGTCREEGSNSCSI
jgi:hypothetical protein